MVGDKTMKSLVVIFIQIRLILFLKNANGFLSLYMKTAKTPLSQK